MQSIQDNINDDEVKKKFNELKQELGDKLKYNVDELLEIFNELKQNGYIINGFLGSGTEGPVFSVININEGNQIAVKVISGSDASKINNELKIIEKFKNQPYIHQYVSMFYSENNKYFFYLTEKLTCDLEQIMLVMKDKKQKLSYNQIIAFAIQMATVLSILESNKVIHSDLKPANILYDRNNKCFKMSDYGFSKIIQQQQSKAISATKNINGCTFKYAAPEIWKQNQDYSCKIDIYSLGLVLLELICGIELSLFQATGISTGAASASNYLGDSGKQYDSLNRIIQSMLVIDRQNRISASNLLQKLRLLQSEEESSLCKQLDISSYLKIRVDEITLQNMEYSLKQLKQLHSSSLTQININNIKDTTKLIKWNSVTNQSLKNVIINQQQLQVQQPQLQLNNYQQIVQPLLKQHKQLKFKDMIETIKELTEVEEALAKYQNDINTSLHVGLQFYGYKNELTNLGASVVASRLALSLEKCSASITSLSLSFYEFKIGPEGMKSISQSIGMMCQNLLVVGLKFGYCNIGSDEIKYLSQSLEKCDKMTTLGLYLYENYRSQKKIGPTGASYLAQSLPKCKSLTELTLSLIDQNIANEGLQSLSSGLSKCEKLTRLNVNISDSINKQSIEEFGSSLARCPNLITLGVNFQFRRYESLKYAITPRLPLFAKLTTLTLFLDAANISTLETNLKECYNLTSLCLSLQNECGNIYLTLDNTNSLVESPEKSNLTTLKLIFCRFEFRDQTQQQQQANRLGESLSKFKKLTSLYLFFEDSNNLTSVISTLLSNLAKNKNITTLTLGVNGGYYDSSKLTSSNTQMIGESLEKCKYLQTLNLYLWDNKIYSQGALVISKSLSKYVHLTALDLSIIEWCCQKDDHQHEMDSVSPTITNDLKKCKNLEELKVDIKGSKGEDDRWEIKLGILTQFEYNFA